MEILAIDSTHLGSCHDSFIWNSSEAREYFSRLNIPNSFVLADSAYTLENFVLTPYRSPQNGSTQHIFNNRHAAARNIVERTIGLLKSRFRCLQGTLQYDPRFVCKLINVYCALHNMCRRRNIQIPGESETSLEPINIEIEDEVDADAIIADGNSSAIRDAIASSLI